MTKIKNFNDLYEILPKNIKNKLNMNKDLVENPIYHPEPNAFEHIKIVIDRLVLTKDINLILSGLFHDICKKESSVARTNSSYMLCLNHEKLGADFAIINQDFIKALGGDINQVYYICRNHMRMKVFNEMKKTKQKEISNSPYYFKLKIFAQADKMTKPFNFSYFDLLFFKIKNFLLTLKLA